MKKGWIIRWTGEDGCVRYRLSHGAYNEAGYNATFYIEDATVFATRGNANRSLRWCEDGAEIVPVNIAHHVYETEGDE